MPASARWRSSRPPAKIPRPANWSSPQGERGVDIVEVYNSRDTMSQSASDAPSRMLEQMSAARAIEGAVSQSASPNALWRIVLGCDQELLGYLYSGAAFSWCALGVGVHLGMPFLCRWKAFVVGVGAGLVCANANVDCPASARLSRLTRNHRVLSALMGAQSEA